jgi:hypothetical protein
MSSGSATRPRTTFKVERIIFIEDATICDGPTANDCHPLVNGIIVEGGPVKVKTVKTDLDCQVQALFIPGDESATYPATSATVSGASGVFTWDFDWANLPTLGQDSILRLMEMPTDGNGAAVNFTVHVVADPTLNLTFTEIH